jgi:hypothetical protein
MDDVVLPFVNKNLQVPMLQLTGHVDVRPIADVVAHIPEPIRNGLLAALEGTPTMSKRISILSHLPVELQSLPHGLEAGDQALAEFLDSLSEASGQRGRVLAQRLLDQRGAPRAGADAMLLARHTRRVVAIAMHDTTDGSGAYGSPICNFRVVVMPRDRS